MKTIKTITAALLLTAGMAAQAQQVMTVRTADSNDKFQLTSRLVLDLTKDKPVVRTSSQTIAYASGQSLLMYLMPTANETYQIIDGAASFYNPEDRYYKQITYTRNYPNLGWQILYLPLRLEYNEWNQDFDVARLNDIHQYDTNTDGRIDVTELEVVLLRDGFIEPNTPYVIRPRRTGTITITQNGGTLYASEQAEKTVSNWNTDFTVHGTYNAIAREQLPDNVFYDMGTNTLSMMGGEGKIDAFRWYVTVSGRNNAQPDIREIRIREFSTEEDAIRGISADDNSNDAIYDISGRKVNRPVKGIYIRGGKKIAVK